MKNLFFFIVIHIVFSTSAQVADFYKEELQFAVDSERFYMQGDFYLARQSTSAQTMQLVFPVPQGTINLIDSFKVYDYSSQQMLAYQRGVSEFIFTVPFNNKDSIVFNIQYRQKICDTVLSYIITTVQDWHRPLKYASYCLRVPNYCIASRFSLPVDKSTTVQNYTLYWWERQLFTPHHEFSFTCKCQQR